MATKRKTTASRSSDNASSDSSERVLAPENGDTPITDSLSSTARTERVDNHREGPPRSKPTHTISLQEKLAVIDSEIRTLHEFCINQGCSPLQIEEYSQSLREPVVALWRRRWLRRLGSILAIFLLATMMIYWNPTYKILRSYSKRLAIQMLPYWDWTTYHRQDCLIDNPYYVGKQLTKDDCELCENLEAIDRVNNLSQAVMAEDFLKRDIPVIVTDAMDDWPARDKFNIHFLNDLYANEGDLREILPCMFASNVRIKYGNPRALLKKAVNAEISNWYAHWENCEKLAAKVLRQFYKRPYFVPPMVEMGESNWLFIASQYRGKKSKPADIALPMVYYAQIKGESKVQLQPRRPCNESCSTLYATIHEGEILVFTDLMWLFDYIPMGLGETIAIAAGGFFD